MKIVRSYHWFITAVLFLVAILLYLLGFGIGAAALVVLGFIVETTTWISLATHASYRSDASAKR